jgi:transposase-like protein
VPRIPDEKRAAILAEIKAGEKSRNQIARDHDVSVGSVTNIARAAGMTDAFDRSSVENATRAVVADNRSRRAALASALLDDADKLRARAWGKYEYYERGQFGPELVSLDKPPLRDAKEAYVALGIALDKHVVLERHDATDPGVMGSLLGTLLDGLQAKHGTGDA